MFIEDFLYARLVEQESELRGEKEFCQCTQDCGLDYQLANVAVQVRITGRTREVREKASDLSEVNPGAQTALATLLQVVEDLSEPFSKHSDYAEAKKGSLDQRIKSWKIALGAGNADRK